MLASLLALSDVFATGHHAVVKAGVRERTTVTVIGDGAVGLSAVLAARRLGAERILLMGRHTARTDLGRESTDVVADRGDEGIAKVGGLSSGEGAHAVLGCVGTKPGFDMGAGVVRAGGTTPRRRPAVRRGPDRPVCVPQPHHRHRRHRARGMTTRSCCQTSSKARSSLAASSTRRFRSTWFRPATRRWLAGA
jgi:hypothetical protein